jgi:thiamine-monophosphate kinase
MSRTGEFDLIARLDAVHAGSLPAEVALGIGDDAAVLTLADRTVWTVDAQVDHVHFERGWLSADDIGFRAHAAATSDVYAMGAVPVASLASYILSSGDAEVAEGLARGARASASCHGAPTVGGNVSRGTELSVTTTVVGTTRAAVLRSGAKAGDLVLVAGNLGYAALGFHALRDKLDAHHFAPFIDVWRRPLLAVTAARELVHAHAAIDASDGLAQDLGHVLTASGTGAILDAEAVVDRALADACATTSLSALGLALHGGEDYALLCTADRELPGFRTIGVVTAEGGLRVRHPGGRIEPIAMTGHVHAF